MTILARGRASLAAERKAIQQAFVWFDHRVGREVGTRYRGNILLGQLPHNTAVIVEKTGGTKLVVDMWPTAYGQVPDVMPLTKWLEEK